MASKSGQQLRRMAAQMHALTAVRHEIGSRDSASGRKYLREFTESFRQYDSVLSHEQANEKIAAADVLLIGDYHALPASQRFAAELVEKCGQERPVVLAVEAVLARDQRILDAWWRREIAEDELRRRLRFDREWGYEWGPFYELLSAARDHAEGLYGLDCMPREDLRRIRSRDRHAAAKLCEIRARHPKAAIFVLFGESHMAPQHLPCALQDLMPQQRTVTVLQNVDALYWQAMGRHAPAVSIGEETLCVFNSSPLEKYESYRLCLDRWNAASDDLPDFAPAVYNLIFSLARSLGFRLDSPRNGTQPKFLADSLPEVLTLKQDDTCAETAGLEERSCLYLPESNSFLVREFQIAHAAEECTRFLHFACRGMTKTCPQARPIEDALARFGSRLLCPEFNADQPQDPTLGDVLYRAYLTGQITQPTLRRLFLAHLENREQAECALAEISKLGKE